MVGRTFESVEVLHPRATRGQDAPLGELIVGARVRAVARRGKYMWLELADEPAADPARNVVFIHLGMSGQLRVGHNDSAHVRIRTRLSGGVELDFIDQRTFGRWHFGPLATISHIARDPLDPNFDIAAAARRITAKKVPIKTVLLDQTVVSGIGNIYADEALWLAGLDPESGRAPCDSTEPARSSSLPRRSCAPRWRPAGRASIPSTSMSTVSPGIFPAT